MFWLTRRSDLYVVQEERDQSKESPASFYAPTQSLAVAENKNTNNTFNTTENFLNVKRKDEKHQMFLCSKTNALVLFVPSKTHQNKIFTPSMNGKMRKSIKRDPVTTVIA